MSTAEEARCSCGCSQMTVVTDATEPCGCGCTCCEDGGEPKPKAQEIDELHRLRASIEARLTELGHS